MHLSAKAIADMAGQKKVHFLNEAAVRINKSLGDAVGLKNIGVHVISVLPGHYSTEHHVHLFEEECVYVLSGQGTAFIGNDAHAVGPGDFIGCPLNGVAHSMLATGSEPLVCLVMGQRLSQDVTDYPNQNKRLYRNNGEWNVVDHSNIQNIER
ncbi:cupin domain-containing protein [Nodosilinea sp. P-1105]|uniref:cupin domain-containing protein n=1 Tax=Nodosilinea sp. P-1105 TaxID=2546229 RepID=UPI00146B6B1E|nr:cupin domain-containing protein [Nodosilinea sp. P-1105]NMF86452.1 cupin domain-containing protein [Nodosilinea sp. P-1105]